MRCIAQLVEQRIFNSSVLGSNPNTSKMKSFFGKKLKAILQNLQIFKIGLLEIVVIVIQQKWSIRTIILL